MGDAQDKHYGGGVWRRLLDSALEAMSRALEAAAEKGDYAGWESLADWMNNADTVSDEDIANFAKIKIRFEGNKPIQIHIDLVEQHPEITG